MGIRDAAVGDVQRTRAALTQNRQCGMVEGALILIAVATCLAIASNFSGAPGFLKNWAVAFLVAVGLLATGAFLGRVAWSAMCAGPWVCK
jgi:hypothetical protein